MSTQNKQRLGWWMMFAAFLIIILAIGSLGGCAPEMFCYGDAAEWARPVFT